MARLGSRQIAGYYPTPPHLVARIASTVRWPDSWSRPPQLLDPCAGEGETIARLRELWAPLDGPHHARGEITACELEAERAGALEQHLAGPRDRALHGDAFHLVPSRFQGTGQARATVLYLNPPYDHDPEHGRLEQRFLARFTDFLHPGAGVLLFVVPGPALAASAGHLARHFADIRCRRFPDEDFEAFRQVVLVARRRPKPLPEALGAKRTGAERIEAWAAEPEALAPLPEALAPLPAPCPEPLDVEPAPEPPYALSLQLEPLDLACVLEHFRPWEGEPVGVEHPVADLLAARFETAMPPKPAHIALALSSGMFNGRALEANDPSRHPRILAKGVFERTSLEVDRKTNPEGEVTGIVEVEQPRLRLTILRLDSFDFHELPPGTVPAGGDEPAEWNAADLIAHYDQALSKLLTEQFPAIHDPADEAAQLAFPALPRKPYRIQSQAVQASLKLLARGRNPFLIAEVGTGKTTMALTIAALLSPQHHAATAGELARLRLARPPRVGKTLVLCPPHLVATWREEAEAVVPDWAVQEVTCAADLERDAQLYLLSRETAKLGHARAGVSGPCPGCGAPVETSAKATASRRLRCRAQARTPLDPAARLAGELATLLLPALPAEALVRSLVPHHRWLAHIGEKAEPRSLNAPALEDFRRRLVAATLAAQEDGSYALKSKLFEALPEVSRSARRARATLAALDTADIEETWYLKQCRTRLQNQAAEGEAGEGSPDPKALLASLELLHEAGSWQEAEPCGEPLYASSPKPRRVALAEIIQRRHRRDFQLVILDEAHEYGSGASAQSKAAHRLTGLPGASTLVLTGSLMGGYASSLFTNFWHLSPLFCEEFSRDEKSLFVQRYGYRKTLRTPKPHDQPSRRGRHTDRDLDTVRILGEAPGVLPPFILEHLLPTAILVHKEDLDEELPERHEAPAPLTVEILPAEEDGEEPAEDLLASDLMREYRRLESRLLARIKEDRFDPELSGRLLGALVEMPSYLDRATDDLDAFELRYPESVGGHRVAIGRCFPASWTTPKEQWLLAALEEHRAAGERVLVFLRHTGSKLPGRLLRLIRERVTRKVAWLDAKKVSAGKRQAWIDRHVVGQGVEVLLVNPNAVRTGLNNLVTFSAAIWYELDWSATTYRQANGRIHRIGQTKPVTIRMPFYAGTAQEVGVDLVAKKVTASLQVDGLSLQGALEAAGASDEHTAAVTTAMSLGQAVYDALTRPGRPRVRRGVQASGRRLASPSPKPVKPKPARTVEPPLGGQARVVPVGPAGVGEGVGQLRLF